MRFTWTRLRTTIVVALTLLVPIAPTVAQLCAPSVTPGVDNRDGYLPPFEEQPVRPMALSSNAAELWVVNIPDARVSVFDATAPAGVGGPALLDEIAVGLGPVTVQPRPTSGGSSPEMWVVCTASNSVVVIDEASRRVITAIRVEHEPGDLVFDATGDTAYVSLSASNQVAVIDATNRTVSATRIEFESVLPTVGGTEIHAEEPLALMLEGTDLYGVSHLSGNGTTVNALCGGNPCFPPVNFLSNPIVGMAQLWDLFNGNPNLPEPPDRDVFRFDVTAPTAAGTVVGWRFGTLNFDLQREPGGPDLVLSNVDLANDQVAFEPFYALDRFAKHRISMGPDAPAAISNTAVVHFDLNDMTNVHGALMTLDYSCAFPNQMAFNSLGDRLYVACYGTNNVAVLDYPPTQVIAELRSNATSSDKRGFGTHGVLLDEARGVVYTYEQGDGSLQVYAANPGVGTVSAPVHATPTSIGFDITPPSVEAGRFHFNNAKNSTFGTESCATCHYRVHFDGIAWDLGDVSGDLPTDPSQGFPANEDRVVDRDKKLIKVTMSLRGIEETPPFHWRGDREDLQAFGDAQVGLLGGGELTPEQLRQIDDFVFSVSYRPNPDQSFDRVYSATAIDGASCFTNPTPLQFHDDTNGGTIDLTCNDCHAMAAFSGTNNQVNNDLRSSFSGLVTAEDATQLAGLWDKASDPVVYFPSTQLTVPATGWGFANSGISDSVAQFISGVNLPQNELDAIVTFFDEFDTKMAPTTAYAFTLDSVSASNIPNDAVTMFLSAEAGHNDAIARGWVNLGGGPQAIGMLYVPNPLVPLGGQFVTDTSGVGPFSGNTLIQLAQAGNAVLQLTGTPVGLGYRLALDREMDFALDGDESATCPPPPAQCASSRSADTDGDLFPDGYELRLSTNPNDATDVPTTDVTAPTIQNAGIASFNSNVAKIRWTTDEESRSRVRVFDTGGGLAAVAEDRQFKTQHVEVVRGLIPGQTYTVEIESEDPANANLVGVPGNQQQLTLPTSLVMQPRLFQNAMHVEATRLAVRALSLTGQILLRATFTLHDGATSAPLANTPVTVTFDHAEWIPGGAGVIAPTSRTVTGTTDAQGRISRSFTANNLVGQGAVAEVIVRDVIDSGGFRLLFQPESGLHGFGDKINLP